MNEIFVLKIGEKATSKDYIVTITVLMLYWQRQVLSPQGKWRMV